MLTFLTGELAGILSFIGFVPYIYGILNGKCVPNRATWFIWTVVGTVLCLAQFDISEFNLAALWVPLSYVLGPLTIFVLSLKYGVGGYTKFDAGCLLISFLGLCVWVFLDWPLVALLINIGIDMVGAIPTIKKTYYEPRSESLNAWLFFVAANLINVNLAFGPGPWEQVLYPIYLFLLSATIYSLSLREGKELISEDA